MVAMARASPLKSAINSTSSDRVSLQEPETD